MMPKHNSCNVFLIFILRSKHNQPGAQAKRFTLLSVKSHTCDNIYLKKREKLHVNAVLLSTDVLHTSCESRDANKFSY